MYYITKEVLTETAHRLYHHNGKCNNVHGHTYKWRVTLKSKRLQLDKEMVVDFALLKEWMTDHIVNVYDHVLVLNRLDKLCSILTRVKRMHGDPTAENMAESVFYDLQTEARTTGVSIHKVTVWETPTSFACYKEV